MVGKITRIVVGVIAFTLLLIALLMLYIKWVSAVEPPTDLTKNDVSHDVVEADTGLFVIDNNWFRQSESGLYELYIEGSPFERGVRIGALTRDLVHYQEQSFIEQINRIVPSDLYRTTLKFFIGYFTRNLPDYVDQEFKEEIYGISQFSSDEFNHLVPDPYQRLLNYHAAHDVGHALQNMSLVGCTAFATWGSASSDSSLIVARNFDFYVGEDFARNKIIAFYNPDKGHKFMTVTFGGMTGVLSGMNLEGLSVTLNAAKSEIPSSAATPVSIVAREILQYASTIEEAFEIAKKREVFVAESFLIGSAKDGRAAVIEKGTESTELYASSGNTLVCTNHFQSALLGNTDLNKEHIATSASPYRHDRVEELLAASPVHDVKSAVAILRDPFGLNNKTIGFGNEKTINQFIAHHGIVFQPEKRLVWVSTAPWQLGKFVCYDLNKIFNQRMTENMEVYEENLMIGADKNLSDPKIKKVLKAMKFRAPFSSRENMNPDSLIAWNPEDYYMYMLAGDFYLNQNDFSRAKEYYLVGLTKEIATEHERRYFIEKVEDCNKELE